MRLKRHQFLAWLKTKRPDEIVGKNRDCHGCPIALFYEHATGGSEIVIFERYGDLYIDRGYDARRMPAWAERFVRDVDDDQPLEVSAARCLELLAARPHGTEER
jgi:hypothetical protein